MPRPTGDQFRESSFQSAETPAQNLPDLFPVEEWRAHYWTLERSGSLVTAHAAIHLPHGLASVTAPVEIGEPGVVERVRRWGVTLRGGIYEDLQFDLTPLLTHDPRFSSDDAEALHLITMLTHFDLPGYFIIASEEHPFLLFDPEGILKGSYTRWFTYAGALAFLISDGKMRVSFDLVWREDRQLYRRVMNWLNEELHRRSRG